MITDIFKTNPFAVAWRRKLKAKRPAKKEWQCACGSLAKLPYWGHETEEGNILCLECKRLYSPDGKELCDKCLGMGFITKTEWAGTDDSYEVEVRCSCQED